MKKILIFGNSGSGKSTLAQKLQKSEYLAHLDLDTISWKPTNPPERKALSESKSEIIGFINSNSAWVIEGCYSDLLEIVAPFSNEVIFMNLPVQLCIENARSRPWEPHKYESKESQDENLGMLIEWISQYSERTDVFSKASHKKLYEQYTGRKREITKNE